MIFNLYVCCKATFVKVAESKNGRQYCSIGGVGRDGFVYILVFKDKNPIPYKYASECVKGDFIAASGAGKLDIKRSQGEEPTPSVTIFASDITVMKNMECVESESEYDEDDVPF